MASRRIDSRAIEDSKAILNRVRQLVRALRVFEKDAQRAFGIGAAQMFILHVLAQGKEISLNELADRTATDQSSVSLAVSSLVRRGYVGRAESSEDRRQVRLSLTAKGRKIVRRSPPAAQERILESVVSMAAAERAQLMTLLDRLIGGMGAESERVPMLFQDPPQPAPRRRRRRSTR